MILLCSSFSPVSPNQGSLAVREAQVDASMELRFGVAALAQVCASKWVIGVHQNGVTSRGFPLVSPLSPQTRTVWAWVCVLVFEDTIYSWAYRPEG